jgi:hypothetical protein
VPAWNRCDFDFDGLVNLNDFNQLASQFGRSGNVGPSRDPRVLPLDELA